MGTKPIILLFAGLFATAACNKNTTQLPPISAPPATITIPTGDANLEVIVSQTTAGASDTVWAWVRNQGNQTLKDVQVLVEFCNALPHNYDNCNLQKPLTISELKPNDTAGKTLLYINKGIVLDSQKINAAILRYSGSGDKRETLYDDIDNLVTITSVSDSDTTVYYGDVKGYIQANGRTTLRVRWGDSVYYNFIGRIDPDNTFKGRLYEGSFLLMPITSGKLGDDGNYGDTLRFSMFDNSAIDSIRSVFFTLKHKQP